MNSETNSTKNRGGVMAWMRPRRPSSSFVNNVDQPLTWSLRFARHFKLGGKCGKHFLCVRGASRLTNPVIYHDNDGNNGLGNNRRIQGTRAHVQPKVIPHGRSQNLRLKRRRSSEISDEASEICLLSEFTEGL